MDDRAVWQNLGLWMVGEETYRQPDRSWIEADPHRAALTNQAIIEALPGPGEPTTGAKVDRLIARLKEIWHAESAENAGAGVPPADGGGVPADGLRRVAEVALPVRVRRDGGGDHGTAEAGACHAVQSVCQGVQPVGRTGDQGRSTEET